MALNNLTGQQIQNTYHKLVQTDGTFIADGTGSELPIKFEGPDLIVSGALRAQSYKVSESIINTTSGSTRFWNSSDDTHTFIGDISGSGDMHIAGDISASNITVDAETITIGNQSLSQAHLDLLKIGKSIVETEDKKTTDTEINDEDKVTNSVNYIRNDMWLHKTDDESALIHNTAHALHFRSAGGDPFRLYTDGGVNNFVRLGVQGGSNLIFRGNITASGDISASGDIIGTINGGTF